MVLGNGICLGIGIPDMGIPEADLEPTLEEAGSPDLRVPFYFSQSAAASLIRKRVNPNRT